ncbi:TldD/PmbA family protein [Candidatus Acetothermia bacterium]|nr:TldD/PmbA family protein [Candidatus Acetothermia bacterium]
MTKINEMLTEILQFSRAEQTEIVYMGTDSALTRFTNNYIHQNVAEKDGTVSIRVVIGKKIGTAATNQLDKESLRNTVEKAVEIAATQRDDPYFQSLPMPTPLQKIKTYVSATAKFTPQQRAQTVATIVKLAEQSNLIASGAISTNTIETAVVNSLGVNAYQRGTSADLNLIISSNDGASGYATYLTRDVTQIDIDALAEQAIDKCLQGKDPIMIEPGEYVTILEPDAVGTFVSFLGYLGMGALALQEGRSFMTNKLGQQITGSNITIWDDGLNPQGMPIPFDFEGVAKKKVSLIEKGVAKGVVYDSYTAGRQPGKESTGHALPAPNSSGPMPLHLFMKEGDSSLAEMIASTERGIYVTRFHYTNPVEPMSTTITGLTRDGTFLIEEGRITSPLVTLRFTDSILTVLSHVSQISKETVLVGSYFGGSRVPAIKTDRLRFSGSAAKA